MPFLPDEHHHRPAAILVACWSGEEAEGRDVVNALHALGPARAERIGRMPYPEINTLFDGLLPAGLRHYWRSGFLADVPADALEPFIEHGRSTPDIESAIFFYPSDGAAADVGASETAWAHRDARYLVGFHGSWHDAADDARLRTWVDRAHAACAAAALPGAYVNFASDDAASAPADYGAKLARLVAVKRRYDPHNLFCLNANIDPDEADREEPEA